MLEPLESRRLLAVMAEFSGGHLHVDADGADDVAITTAGGNVLVNGAAPDNSDAPGQPVPALDIQQIRVAATGDFENTIDLSDVTAGDFGPGLTTTIHAGDGNDTVVGSEFRDVIAGGAGDDSIHGGAGDDLLVGGAGDDQLFGEAGNDQLDGGGEISITVQNLAPTDGTLITPVFLAAGDGQYDFFNVGSPASGSLERLAEDGNVGPRIDAALGTGQVAAATNTPGGPISPGESRTVTIDVSSLDDLGQFLSFASMVIPSNDAFVANDDPQALPLFDANGDLIERLGASAFIVQGSDVYDAGTEVNDEIPANTAALAQAAPNTGVDENGVIAPHPGFLGSSALGGPIGNILAAFPNGDFTVANYEVLSIEVTSSQSGNDQLHGGDGDDEILGGDGNDVIAGGAGNDTASGGDGDDLLIGGGGDDNLFGNAGDDRLDGGGQFTVTITNLAPTDGTLITPVFLAASDGQYDFFNVGSPASGSLERLAEDGNVGPRIDAALGTGQVAVATNTPNGPIAPGDSRTVTFDASALDDLAQFLSFASMVIPSNDAFVANDDPQAIPLFDTDGNLIERTGASAFIVEGSSVYDAGAEVNDEIPANTAALAQAAPDTGVDENGVIAPHPGFQGSSDLGGPIGNILTAIPNGDFTVPDYAVLSIEVTSVTSGNDQLHGGDGDDEIKGGDGDDTIAGGAGDDTAAGDAGDDLIVGGQGDDTASGGDGDDLLIGGAGADNLYGNDGNDRLDGGGEITVTITNLAPTDGTLITPVFLAASDGQYDFFDVGAAASPSLERLAEDGNVGPRIDAALGTGQVAVATNTPNGPIAPGESRTVTFDASSLDDLAQFLSFASMVIPSNDAFVANDDPQAIPLFDANGDLIERIGRGAFVVDGDQVYDAGTEVNDEIPANTAALAQAAPNTGVTEGGVITAHEGFQGSRDFGGPIGNILTAIPEGDFTSRRYEVLSIEVTAGDDEGDRLHGGAGDDMLTGGAGDDTLIGGAGNDDLSGGAGDDILEGDGRIQVQVTNLAPAGGTLLTPVFLATTNGVYDFFDVGSAASPGLEQLAEDGNASQRITDAVNSGGVRDAVTTLGGPLAPGESRIVEFDVSNSDGLAQFLSFATMVIPSNDAFVGNDDPDLIPLFDDQGNIIERTGVSSIVIQGSQVYDAGTEVNDEIPENTAALAQAAPNTGVTEGGVITQHPGFLPGGNVLNAIPNGDFTTPNYEVLDIVIQELFGNDTLRGGKGDDELFAGGGDDTIVLDNLGNDSIEAGAGEDTVELSGTDGRDFIGIFQRVGDIHISSRSGGNTAIAEGTVERLQIDTGAGSDRVIVFRLNQDSGITELEINTGDGNDSVNAFRSRVPLKIDAGSGNDTVFGGNAADQIIGGDGRDRIHGGNGNDVIQGGDGRDYIFGGFGDDEIDGGDGNDWLWGGHGADVIRGGNGNDFLLGGRGPDELYGEEGNDFIYGGRGDDLLRGGPGIDRIIGGPGQDDEQQ